ncbi:MAG: DUF3958 family protein [Bacilli bacterium]
MKLDNLLIEESKLEYQKEEFKSEALHLKKISDLSNDNYHKATKLFNELDDQFNADKDSSFYEVASQELRDNTKHLFVAINRNEDKLNECLKQVDDQLEDIYRERNRIFLEEKRESNEY